MDGKYMQDLLYELGRVVKGKAARSFVREVVTLHQAARTAQAAAGDPSATLTPQALPGEAPHAADPVPAGTLLHYYDFVVWWFYKGSGLSAAVDTLPLQVIRSKLRGRQKARHKLARKLALAAAMAGGRAQGTPGPGLE